MLLVIIFKLTNLINLRYQEDTLWSGVLDPATKGTITLNGDLKKYKEFKMYATTGYYPDIRPNLANIVLSYPAQYFINLTGDNNEVMFSGSGFCFVFSKTSENTIEVVAEYNFISDGAGNNRILKITGVY